MIGRVLYGAAFCVALPCLLAAWAWVLDRRLVEVLPGGYAPTAGGVLLASGLAVMLWSFHALWVHGRGLPMNAFPPERYVTRGPYALVRHPIYLGFGLAVLGAALLAGSPSGVWIVAPIAALGCASLAIGFENHDLRRRFGEAAANPPFLHLAPATDAPPTLAARISLYVLVFLPWLAVYEILGHLGPPQAISTYLDFETRWPVLVWTEPAYAAGYPLALIPPLLLARSRDLRRFEVAAIVGTALGGLLFFLLPLRAEPRPFEPEGLFGWMLALERSDGVGGRAAFPSFHVFWAILGAWACARISRGAGILGWVLAAAVIASCVTTGMHSLADLAGGIALAAVSLQGPSLWNALARAAQRIANSWREWHLGPLRIINHGAYAGLAAAAGILIVSAYAGPHALGAIVLTALATLIMAGLWGQYFVGSRTLLRPFGYFGAVLGAALGLSLAPALGVAFWPFAGAVVLAAPWVQGIGRLRCLVQGCCHGAPADHPWAIRYHHPLSRVCRVSHLQGVPVHPTPLYSLAWCAVLGLFLLRLRYIELSPALTCGLYLILNGLARFVEESYRGEVQTPVRGGLRLYQWFAIASVGAGVVVSALPCTSAWPAPGWNAAALPAALGLGLVFWFAMGMDFPASNRRFSRLT